MNLKDLSKPFPAQDIEWRVGRCGTYQDGNVWASVLAYINARAIMERLDEVVGPHQWRDRYWTEGKAVMCGLSIKIGDEWIEKVDGAEETDIEPVKGGLSGALKRAAVKWGIGRYLYKLEEGRAKIVDKSDYWGKTKDNKTFYWLPPQLPAWALPENTEGTQENGTPKGNPGLKAVDELPEFPPPQKPAAAGVGGIPGAYVMICNPHKGTRLDAMDVYALDKWVSGWKGKAVSGALAKDLAAAEAFLNTRDVSQRAK